VSRYSHTAKIAGRAPSTTQLAVALWGEDADFDSDGDPNFPWELTVSLRPGETDRVDIDSAGTSSDRVKIRTTRGETLDRALSYLRAIGAISG